MPPPSPAKSSPNPLGSRLYLLCILLLLPVMVVSLPTLIVNHFFGQRPTPRAAAQAEKDAAAFASLRGSLEKAAREGLPDAGLDLGAKFDALTLACPPEAAEARLDTLRAFAVQCQGIVLDQPADAAGRHLLIELPEGNAARFRQLAATGSSPESPPPAAGTTTLDATKVFLNVTLAPPPAAAASSTAAVKPVP